MKSVNFSQILFLLRNNTNIKLSKVLDRHNFFLSFINHLQEYLRSANKNFLLLQPILDPTFREDTNTVLSINDVEVGEIHLLFNSNYGESSLVYNSPSGLIQSTVFEYDKFDEWTISDYALLIYEFSATLVGFELLYKNEK